MEGRRDTGKVVRGRRRVGVAAVVAALAVGAALLGLTVSASAQKGQDDGVNAALTTATISSAGARSTTSISAAS